MAVRVDSVVYNDKGSEFVFNVNEDANAYFVGEKGNLNLYIAKEKESIRAGRLIQTYAAGNWTSVRVVLEESE